MNKVILMGRVTRDPECRKGAENTTTVARYTLAVDRRYKTDDGASADFISCVTFGKNAEFVEKYITKGTKIAVTGRIQTGSYKNNEGKTVYTTDIVVEDHEFAESKKTDGASSAPAAAPAQKTDPNKFMNVPDGIDEELPFN